MDFRPSINSNSNFLMRRHSNNPHVKAKNAAWKSFALWVRTTEKVCFTCGSEDSPNASHFRHVDCLDYDEMNVHRCCSRCNLWLHGNLGIYAIKLIEKYGKKKVDDLIHRSYQVRKFSIPELEKIKKKYDNKLKKLKTPEGA